MKTALVKTLQDEGFTWQRRWFIYNSLLRAITALGKNDSFTVDKYLDDIRRH